MADWSHTDGRAKVRRWALKVSVDTRRKANRDIVAATDARDPAAYVTALMLHARGAKIGARFATR